MVARRTHTGTHARTQGLEHFVTAAHSCTATRRWSELQHQATTATTSGGNSGTWVELGMAWGALEELHELLSLGEGAHGQDYRRAHGGDAVTCPLPQTAINK